MLPLSSGGMTVATIPKSVGIGKTCTTTKYSSRPGGLTTRGVLFELLLVRYRGR